MSSNLNKKVLVFGASGLIGKQLINQLVEKEEVSSIFVVNRSNKNYKSDKIEQIINDLSNPEDIESNFNLDQVYICLGTTIKKAGSRKNFEKVDLELPVKITEIAKKQGVDKIIMISSMGADESSSNFYTRTKGNAESQIQEIGIPHTYFVRPSLLVGERKEKRIGEKIAMVLMTSLSFLFVGPLKKYKAIKDTTVAKAMISIMFSDKESRVFENDELLTLGS